MGYFGFLDFCFGLVNLLDLPEDLACLFVWLSCLAVFGLGVWVLLVLYFGFIWFECCGGLVFGIWFVRAIWFELLINVVIVIGGFVCINVGLLLVLYGLLDLWDCCFDFRLLIMVLDFNSVVCLYVLLVVLPWFLIYLIVCGWFI